MIESLKLSIICPIYNKKVFLKKCLQSIVEACARELCEIILVDDGSTDGSGLIADLFQKNNPNIRVFHTENHGVSVARNYGLNVAKGELVTFVDADDRVIKDSFTQVLSCIDKDTDVFICGAVWGDGDINKCDLREDTVLQVGGNPVFDSFIRGGGGTGQAIQSNAYKYMWGCKWKFYRRSFLFEYNIRFNVTLSRNEDVLYSLDCYYAAKKVRFLPLNVYVNQIDSNGITSSMNMDKNLYNFSQFLDVFFERYLDINEQDEAIFCFRNTLTLLREGFVALKNKKINKRQYESIMRTWFNRDDIKKMVINMPMSKLNKSKQMAFILMKNGLYYLVGIEMDIYTKLKNKNIHIQF